MTITKKTYFEKLREVSNSGQMLWLAISIWLLAYLPTLYNNTMIYRRYRRLELPDYPHETMSDFFMVIPYVMFIRILRFSIDRFTYSFFESKLQNYTGEDLKKKIKKCSKGVFKTFYFGFTFLFGWLKVMSHTSFHPPIMFGSGNLMYVFANWPYTPQPEYMKFYYLLSFSYYVEDLFVHLYNLPDYDFWEMILHHQITCMLIFTSYVNGCWVLGIFVLMQMDISDCFVGAIRTFMDFVSTKISALIYVGIMVTWIYFRVIAYVYWVLYSYSAIGRVWIDNTAYANVVINILLVVLFGLNIYWLYLLFLMGIRTATKGGAVDLQNIVSEKDKEFIAFNAKDHEKK